MILLVEDEQSNVEVLEDMLRSLGVPYKIAFDYHGAVQLLERFKFSLVVTDGNIPFGSGDTVREVAHQKGVSAVWLFSGNPSGYSVRKFDKVFQKDFVGLRRALLERYSDHYG